MELKAWIKFWLMAKNKENKVSSEWKNVFSKNILKFRSGILEKLKYLGNKKDPKSIQTSSPQLQSSYDSCLIL